LGPQKQWPMNSGSVIKRSKGPEGAKTAETIAKLGKQLRSERDVGDWETTKACAADCVGKNRLGRQVKREKIEQVRS